MLSIQQVRVFSELIECIIVIERMGSNIDVFRCDQLEILFKDTTLWSSSDVFKDSGGGPYTGAIEIGKLISDIVDRVWEQGNLITKELNESVGTNKGAPFAEFLILMTDENCGVQEALSFWPAAERAMYRALGSASI